MSLSPDTSLYHLMSEQGFGDWSEDLLYIMQRLRNPGTVGEGAAVVPKLVGFTRVPYASGFGVLSSRDYFGGTEFTLGWITPEDVTQIDRFDIYAVNLLDSNQTPTRVGASPTSPCTVRIVSSGVGVVIFLIQTVLKNGYSNDLSLAPTCTGITVAPEVSASGIADGSISPAKLADAPTGSLISFDAAHNAYILAPGSAGKFLTSQGTGAVDIYKSWDELFLTRVKTTSPTSDFTVDSLNDVYLVDASGGSVAVTLPAAATRNTPIVLKRLDNVLTNTIIITPDGAEVIDGAVSKSLEAQNYAITLLPVSGGWTTIAKAV